MLHSSAVKPLNAADPVPSLPPVQWSTTKTLNLYLRWAFLRCNQNKEIEEPDCYKELLQRYSYFPTGARNGHCAAVSLEFLSL